MFLLMTSRFLHFILSNFPNMFFFNDSSVICVLFLSLLRTFPFYIVDFCAIFKCILLDLFQKFENQLCKLCKIKGYILQTQIITIQKRFTC